jgi:hypothetical protein
MIHSSHRDRRTKTIAEVLAMIADAHPPLPPLRPCPVLETEEWLWESATEFCAALDRYAERAMQIKRESMIRAPLLRSRPSIPRVSGIAERWDCVRQTATRLAEPVRCITEEDQNTRPAVNRFSRRPGVRGPARLARQNS